MKLIIDRNKWLRGEGAEVSRLLRSSDGKMCCLGFHALACGFKKKDILELETPNMTENYPKKQMWVAENFFKINSDVGLLMIENDSKELTDEEREEKISTIFARHDVEVEFIN